MLLKDNRVLLGKRHSNNKVSNSVLGGESTWTMPGGKLEYQETFEDCAKRETFEECGIILNNVKVLSINNDKGDMAHFVTIGLFSDDFTGDPVVKEPNKIIEWKWFDLNDLPSPLYFPSEKGIKNFLEKKFYIPNN